MRGSFLAIAGVTLLAALVLVAGLVTWQRAQLTVAAGRTALQLARLGASAHERMLADTQQTLELLARMPAVRSGEGCAALLAELRRRLPRYVDLGVARPNGDVVCRAQPAAAGASVADRAWFRSAAEWRQLGVGEYRLERATGRSAVTVAVPVLDVRGRLPAVVFAVVDVAWPADLAALAAPASGVVLALIDRDGTVLARQPAAAGGTERIDRRLEAALAAPDDRVVETPVLDGTPRVLAFTRVARRNGAALTVAGGVPVPTLAAAGRALNGMVWVALLVVLAGAAAAGGGEVLLRRRELRGRQRAEQDRQQRRDTLHHRDKLASMATLLADVAHELNNPLTVIIAGATLLRDATRDESVHRRAELLEQAAERCALTIRNFLALVRQYPVAREDVALERIVKETLALVAYQLEVDEVSVDVVLPRDLPGVWADPHQLHQVLLNLVTNARHALRATPPPRRLAIDVRHDAEARRVVLAVTDSGPGVAPELRSLVFRPFFTTKPPEEGTGLGLALCHDIVAAHGGTIRVDGAPGGGARFVVELPLGRPEDAAIPAPAAAPRPTRRGHVLVVDDDAELASVVATALRGEHHTVETAANGMEALAALTHARFDVILSDVRMPKLDGPGFYRELQQQHPAMLDRIIFVTGDTLGRDTAAFLERTRVTHLTKPFDVTQVRRVVADVLERSAS